MNLSQSKRWNLNINVLNDGIFETCIQIPSIPSTSYPVSIPPETVYQRYAQRKLYIPDIKNNGENGTSVVGICAANCITFSYFFLEANTYGLPTTGTLKAKTTDKFSYSCSCLSEKTTVMNNYENLKQVSDYDCLKAMGGINGGINGVA